MQTVEEQPNATEETVEEQSLQTVQQSKDQEESVVSEEQYTSVKFGINRTLKRNKELKEELSRLSENKRGLEESINELNAEMEKSREEYKQTRQTNSQELEKSREENQKLQEKEKELEGVIEELRESLSVSQRTVEERDISLREKGKELMTRVAELGDITERYADLKTKYNELDELYNKTQASTTSIETTLSELSNQLNIKTLHMERLTSESNESKRQTILYREENKNLRARLEDKDKYITRLNGEIADLGVRQQNQITPNEQARSGTPRVTIYNEPVTLSAPVSQRGTPQIQTRDVPRIRRV